MDNRISRSFASLEAAYFDRFDENQEQAFPGSRSQTEARELSSAPSMQSSSGQSDQSSPVSLSVAQNGQSELLNRWLNRFQAQSECRYLGHAQLTVFRLICQYQIDCFFRGVACSTVLNNGALANQFLNVLSRYPRLAEIPIETKMEWLASFLSRGQPFVLNQVVVDASRSLSMTFGYFKANKKLSRHCEPKHTLIRSAKGCVYSLLNTLTPEKCAALAQIFNVHFQVGKKVLGRGGNGKVRIAQHYATHKFYSVKKTYDSTRAPRELIMGQKVIRAYQARFGSHSKLGILAAHDFSYRDSNAHQRLPYKNYFFMPLVVGADLSNVVHGVQTNQNLSHQERMAVYLLVATSCARIVANIHEVGFSHRDIKLDNFMGGKITQSNVSDQILLCDFALATTNQYDGQRMLSTPFYSPPEYFVVGQTYSGQLHDAFSMGIDIFDMLQSSLSYTESAVYPINLPNTDIIVPVQLEMINYMGRSCYRCLGVSDDQLNQVTAQPDSLTRIMLELLAANPQRRLTASEAANRLEYLSRLQS